MAQVTFMHDLIQVHKATNHGFVLERESWIELSCAVAPEVSTPG